MLLCCGSRATIQPRGQQTHVTAPSRSHYVIEVAAGSRVMQSRVWRLLLQNRFIRNGQADPEAQHGHRGRRCAEWRSAAAQSGEAPQTRLRRRLTAQARLATLAGRIKVLREPRAARGGQRAARAWCCQPLWARLALLPQDKRRAPPARRARLCVQIAPRAQQTPRSRQRSVVGTLAGGHEPTGSAWIGGGGTRRLRMAAAPALVRLT